MVCTHHEVLWSHVVIKSAKAMIKVLPMVTMDLPVDDASTMDEQEIKMKIQKLPQAL